MRFTLASLALVLTSVGCLGLPVIGGAPDAALDGVDDLADAPADVSPADVAPTDAAPDAVVLPDVPDAARCASDMDCAGNPSGAVCDTNAGRCVQCVAARDTCPAGRYCDTSTSACLEGCRDDNTCVAAVADAGVDAGGPIPLALRCDRSSRRCVECAEDGHCGPGMLCVGNTCVTGCSAMRPCPETQTCCSGACIDTVSNAVHCGRCGNRCTAPNASAACMNSTCTIGTCSPGFADCDRAADNGCEVNTVTDLAHCGACGSACPPRPNAAVACSAGRCEFACNMGFADCDMNPDNGCEVNLNADPANCGRCRGVCNLPNASAACTMGMCGVMACSAGFGDCDMNASNGCEVDLATAVSHCGRCGTACAARPNAFPGCLGGRCVASCVVGFQDCDGMDDSGCEVDVRTAMASCGACGRACSPAHATGACMAGRCAITMCEDGWADCDMDASNGCEVNTRSDPAHCSGCGMRCTIPSGVAACMAGRCDIAACTTGRADCDMTVSNGCEADVTTDTRNCGTCGSACALANATAACAMGRCAVATCNTGFADCDMNPANGCEVNLQTSTAHCGRCGMMCAFPGSDAACERGACRIAMCAAGRGDCDGNSANGCEATLASDARNCGGCGTACAIANGTAACAAGRCAVASCNAGFADCDGAPANGCEVNTRSDAAHCNGCGMRCSLPGATAACVAGRCDIAACDTGRADCNAAAADGCEVTPATDVRNCGACGGACSLPNASAACAGGRCAVGACNAGFADCDMNPANGCEVILASDTANCGACGARCAPANGTGVCASGRCGVLACNPGFADCDRDPSNGCEVTLATDVRNCNACGNVCSPANATGRCAGGACGVASCNGGFGDCNGSPADGCEVNLNTTPTSCGACGRACSLPNASAVGCAGGACTVAACVGGFGNCDGNPANGCEANLASDPSNCGACGRVPAEACNLADDNCNGRCDEAGGCRVGVHRSYNGREHFYTTSLSEAGCCGFGVEYANFYYLYGGAAPGTAPFYRCIMDYGLHFYTTASNCETGRGRVEGIMGYIGTSPACGSVPLYRVYHPGTADHFYTTSAAERDAALRSGYTNEGVAGYVWAGPTG